MECTSCQRLLFRPDELSGRAWQCPTCGPTVVADAAVDVAPELAALLEKEYRLTRSELAAVSVSRPSPERAPPRPEPLPPAPATELPSSLSEAPRVPVPAPEAFRHNWARKALREAGLFLLLAVVVVLVCGLFLPVPSDVYWLLLKLVLGISAGVGVLFYLVIVLPRIVYYRLVDLHRRYGGVPESMQRQWTGRAMHLGLLVGAGVPAILGILSIHRGQVQFGFTLLVCSIALGFAVAWFSIAAVIMWIWAIRVAGRAFGLQPAVEPTPAAPPRVTATEEGRPPSPVTAARSSDSADVHDPSREQSIKPAVSTEVRSGEPQS
jgi:hypothetical protein